MEPVVEQRESPTGPTAIYTKARDAAGNWGTSAKVTITVDNVPG